MFAVSDLVSNHIYPDFTHIIQCPIENLNQLKLYHVLSGLNSLKSSNSLYAASLSLQSFEDKLDIIVKHVELSVECQIELVKFDESYINKCNKIHPIVIKEYLQNDPTKIIKINSLSVTTEVLDVLANVILAGQLSQPKSVKLTKLFNFYLLLDQSTILLDTAVLLLLRTNKSSKIVKRNETRIANKILARNYSTDQIIMLAKVNPCFVEYIDNPSDYLIRVAIFNSQEMFTGLKNVQSLSPENQKFALSLNYNYLNNPLITQDTVISYLQENPKAIMYIKNPSKKLIYVSFDAGYDPAIWLITNPDDNDKINQTLAKLRE